MRQKPAGAFAAPRFTLPTDMTFNTSTGLFEGTVLDFDPTFNLAGQTGTVRTVTAGSMTDLQTQVNAAARGDIVVVPAGFTYSGQLTLPVKSGTGWVYIISDAVYNGSFPRAYGERVIAADASAMAKIVVSTFNGAIRTVDDAHYYRIVGFELTHPAGVNITEALVEFGGVSQTNLATIPSHLVLDRCYVHGADDTGSNCRRGILLNGKQCVLIGNRIDSCHTTPADGSDSQAQWGWNGPGPFWVENNYLAGGHESCGFGGVDPSVAGIVPSDIVYRRNHITRTLAWQSTYNDKNLIELKVGKRVLFDGNVVQNAWDSDQHGWAVVWWSVNQSGNDAQAVTQDVTFWYNWIDNVAGGFQLTDFSRETGPFPTALNRVEIKHNLLTNVGTAALDPGGNSNHMYQIAGTVSDLAIDHNTGFNTPGGLGVFFASSSPTVAPNLTITNNIFGNNVSDLNVFSPVGSGSTALSQYGGGTLSFNKNVVVGGVNGSPANNFYPADIASVGFVNWSTDAHLASGSAYHNAATDGFDIGAYMDLVYARTSGVT